MLDLVAAACSEAVFCYCEPVHVLFFYAPLISAQMALGDTLRSSLMETSSVISDSYIRLLTIPL